MAELGRGGRIERRADGRVVVGLRARTRLRDATYWAMQEHGWLSEIVFETWQLSEAGEAVLASGRVR